MIDKIKEIAELAKGAVFGWRKLGVLIAILTALFVWLFMFTHKVDGAVVVPDLPPVWAGTVVLLYLTFVLGNWGVHKLKVESGDA